MTAVTSVGRLKQIVKTTNCVAMANTYRLRNYILLPELLINDHPNQLTDSWWNLTYRWLGFTASALGKPGLPRIDLLMAPPEFGPSQVVWQDLSCNVKFWPAPRFSLCFFLFSRSIFWASLKQKDFPEITQSWPPRKSKKTWILASKARNARKGYPRPELAVPKNPQDHSMS